MVVYVILPNMNEVAIQQPENKDIILDTGIVQINGNTDVTVHFLRT